MEDLQQIEVLFRYEDGDDEIVQCVIFRKETHGDCDYLLIAPSKEFFEHNSKENSDIEVDVFTVKKYLDVDLTTDFTENLEITESDELIFNEMFENFCEDNGEVAYYE